MVLVSRFLASPLRFFASRRKNFEPNSLCLAAYTMASPSPEDIVQSISSVKPDIKYLAIKQVKNAVIGSRQRKALFVQLGVLSKYVYILYNLGRLANVLSQESATELLIQAAAAIGSIAHGI